MQSSDPTMRQSIDRLIGPEAERVAFGEREVNSTIESPYQMIWDAV